MTHNVERSASAMRQSVAALGSPGGVYRMTPEEIAYGWVYGTSRRRLPAAVEKDPVRALEDVIRPALRRTPCAVSFSGGRDSSVVLAVAVQLARREGLDPPLALTYRYPDVAAAEESSWQESVIAHLGVTNWERLTIRDERDWLGVNAVGGLRQFGPLYPPGAVTKSPIYAQFRGGSILTGELGDDIFGARRGSALRRLRGRRLLYPGLWGVTARSVAPRAYRFARARSTALRQPYRWLMPDLAARRAELAAEEFADEPLSWRLAVWRVVDRRVIRVGMATSAAVAALHDVALVHPLMEDHFVASYVLNGPRLGYSSRAEATRSIAGKVLPDEVLRRTSKASFNQSRFGPHSRAFARDWDGSGVDPEMVNAEVLREEWLSDSPHAGTGSLLQQAWLAGQPMADSAGR